MKSIFIALALVAVASFALTAAADFHQNIPHDQKPDVEKLDVDDSLIHPAEGSETGDALQFVEAEPCTVPECLEDYFQTDPEDHSDGWDDSEQWDEPVSLVKAVVNPQSSTKQRSSARLQSWDTWSLSAPWNSLARQSPPRR